VGRAPEDVAVTPDGTRVYVVNAESHNVSVINTATNTVVSTIAVGNSPAGIAMSPDGSLAYVTDSGDGTLSIIDTRTNTVLVAPQFTPSGPAGGFIYGVAVSRDGSKVYMTDYRKGAVWALLWTS
jgi:YVTN family beta-propeller protein